MTSRFAMCCAVLLAAFGVNAAQAQFVMDLNPVAKSTATEVSILGAKGNQAATNDWRLWPPKTERGSVAEPSPCLVVPPQNPKPRAGSAAEPVRAISAPRFGSGMEH